MNTKPTKLTDFTGPQRSSGTQVCFKFCPMCGANSWKLYVDPLTGRWMCFAGTHSAGGQVEVGLPSDDPGGAILRQLRPEPESNEEAQEIPLPKWHPLSAAAFVYLNKRGVEPDVARGLGLVEEWGTCRILFPFFEKGQQIYWISRAYVKAEMPKYLAAPGERQLYFLQGKSDQVVIVEGVFDAIRVWQVGHSAVAICGTTLPKKLLKKLLTLVQEYATIIIMFDSDALDKALLLLRTIQVLADLGRSVSVIACKPGEDPADMQVNELQEVLDDSTNST